MESASLSRLIHPGTVASFFEHIWGRLPCLYPQSLAGAEDDIMTLGSFETLLGTLNRANEGWLQFARGARTPVPPEMVDSQGMLDLRKIRGAFLNGETLYLTKAERVSPSLMRLSRALELDLVANGVRLRESVNAHVFLTPPSSQGFAAHRDEHASFILQLDGSKEWTIYEPLPQCEDASCDAPFAGAVEPVALEKLNRRTYQLQRGDVLYMPEWWPHQARSEGAHSLHVTLRIFPLRWVDILVELSRGYHGLAHAVPRSHPGEPNALLDEMLNALQSAAFWKWAPTRIEALLEVHAMPQTALPDDGFRQVLELHQIHEDTRVTRSAGTACRVIGTDQHVCLSFPGGMVRGPAAIRPVFEYIASVSELCALDLPSISGFVYDRLELVRRLVRDGMLRCLETERVKAFANA